MQGSMRRAPTQERAKARVAALLDAATVELSEVGYENATTTSIAARAGVPIGSLYQYFPDKASLLYGIADRHLTDASNRMLTALEEAEGAPDLEAAVSVLVGGAIDANRGDPSIHRLLYREAARPPALQARLDELDDALAAWLAEELVRRSVCAPEVAHRRARVLVIAVEALVHDLALDPPAGFSRRVARAEIERVALAIARG